MNKMDCKGVESKQGDQSAAPVGVQAKDDGDVDYGRGSGGGEKQSRWQVEVTEWPQDFDCFRSLTSAGSALFMKGGRMPGLD